MSDVMTAIAVERTFVGGAHVVTWFEPARSVADPVAVANRSHLRDGKIERTNVVFDARPLAPPGR
jgi:hypothetical protein